MKRKLKRRQKRRAKKQALRLGANRSLLRLGGEEEDALVGSLWLQLCPYT